MLLRSFILVSKVWNVKTVCRSLFSFVSAVHSVKILSLRLNYSRQRKETPQSFNLYIYKRSCGIRGKIDHNVLYHTIGLSQFLRHLILMTHEKFAFWRKCVSYFFIFCHMVHFEGKELPDIQRHWTTCGGNGVDFSAHFVRLDGYYGWSFVI